MVRIKVEVAYANKNSQRVVAVELNAGASALDAIKHAGLLADFPGIDLASNKIGIFGKIVTLDTILNDGDRVEIYRALVCDPKELRRRRARQQKLRV